MPQQSSDWMTAPRVLQPHLPKKWGSPLCSHFGNRPLSRNSLSGKCTDTDCFVLQVYTDDVYEDWQGDDWREAGEVGTG